jgi:hypothetical protein
MTAAGQPSDGQVALAVPGAQQPVRHWVGPAVNSSEPPIRRVWPPEPVIIYAQRKPRLSAQDLRARQQRSTSIPRAAAPVELLPARGNGTSGGRAAQAGRRGLDRHWRWLSWSAVALAAAFLSAGTPLL